MKIAIDAGHGLHTPGKRCLAAIDPRETREWQLNSRIAARVCSELERLGCETIRADDPTGQRDVPLAARAQAANRAGCAWYVSIHHDSGIGGGTGGGVTVFSHPSAGHAARRLREAVYRQVVRETGLKGNRSQPLREADFAVLRETDMPAVLIECGFMDSKTDTPLILTADFARRAADGIVQAVCEVGGIAYKPKSSEMEEWDTMPYEQWKRYMERYAAERASAPAHDWAQEALDALGAQGVTDGSRPQAFITREECAAMVYRAQC